MLWYRDNIRHCSWLALIALAINITLSFGHIHVIDGHRAALDQSLLAAVASSEEGQTPGRHDDGRADYLCPICVAGNAIANAFVSAPPALPLRLSDTTSARTIEPAGIFVETPRAAFQSRGPPLS